MFMPLISVIVPAYNVEQYIERCIKSLINQTYQNLEIIIVDDGSIDNTYQIALHYSEKYDYVYLYHKENGGLSDARNYGLNYVRGQYLCFVDSDDWVDVKLLEYIVDTLQQKKYDIVMYGFCHVNNNLETKIKIPLEKGEYNKKEIIDNIILPLYGEEEHKKYINYDIYYSSVCNKCYKVNIIKDTKFLSEREIFSEDLLFNIAIIENSNSLLFIPKSLYFYRYNIQSLTHVYRKNYIEMKRLLYKKMGLFAKELGLPNSYKNRLKRKIYIGSLYCIINIVKSNEIGRKKKLQKIQMVVNNNFIIHCSDYIQLNEISPISHRILYLLINFKMSFLLYMIISFVLKLKYN